MVFHKRFSGFQLQIDRSEWCSFMLRCRHWYFGLGIWKSLLTIHTHMRNHWKLINVLVNFLWICPMLVICIFYEKLLAVCCTFSYVLRKCCNEFSKLFRSFLGITTRLFITEAGRPFPRPPGCCRVIRAHSWKFS